MSIGGCAFERCNSGGAAFALVSEKARSVRGPPFQGRLFDLIAQVGRINDCHRIFSSQGSALRACGKPVAALFPNYAGAFMN
jgi:hypothetical protein